jgi:pimeloyl-ACP methyl ester carboxylesterase
MKKTLLSFLGLIIAAAIGLQIYVSAKSLESKTMDTAARKNISGSFIQLGEGITHYELAGSDTSKTVVLASGFSVPYFIWDSTAKMLIQQGFRVLRYDYYGRGFSDRPNITYDENIFRNQLWELLQKLNIKTPIVIAGVSFGGAVTTDFTAHHPELVEKIILIDPVYNRIGGTSMPEWLAAYLSPTQSTKQINNQLADFKYPEHYPDWTDKYKTQMQYKGFWHALISSLYHFNPDTLRNSYTTLRKLNKPVLLIWGKEDKTIPFSFSDSIRGLIHTDFFAVDDAAHLPHIEKAALVNERIISFLQKP